MRKSLSESLEQYAKRVNMEPSEVHHSWILQGLRLLGVKEENPKINTSSFRIAPGTKIPTINPLD